MYIVVVAYITEKCVNLLSYFIFSKIFLFNDSKL